MINTTLLEPAPPPCPADSVAAHVLHALTFLNDHGYLPNDTAIQMGNRLHADLRQTLDWKKANTKAAQPEAYPEPPLPDTQLANDGACT